jgi:tetratricopeptide (TPR) repeat protein
LSDVEQRIFRHLSVFADGWTLEAAEDVADANVDALQSLVEKNLVCHRGERFFMLQTIRQSAAKRLEEDESASSVRDRHATYFTAYAQKVSAEISNSGTQCELLRADLDNFRTALSWWRSRGAPEHELDLAVSLFQLWMMGGYAAEGRRIVQAALLETTDLPEKLRARANRCAGNLAVEQGDYRAANVLLENALSFYEGLEDQRGLSKCLTDLGHVAKCQLDPVRAEACFLRSIALGRVMGDKSLLALALLNYGDFLVGCKSFAAAESACRESLSLYRELEEPGSYGACLFSLALISLHSRDCEQSMKLLAESLDVFWELRYATGIGYVLEGLGAVCCLQNRTHDAARFLGAAEGLFERTLTSPEPAERALHDDTVGALRMELGDTHLAREWSIGKEQDLQEVIDFARKFARATGCKADRPPAGEPEPPTI